MTPFLYILTFCEFLLSSRVASVHMWQMNRRWNFIVKWHCWLDRQHYNGCYSPLGCPATWMYCSCQKCLFTVSWSSILCYPMSMQFIVLGDGQNLLLKYNVHFQDRMPVARCVDRPVKRPLWCSTQPRGGGLHLTQPIVRTSSVPSMCSCPGSRQIWTLSRKPGIIMLCGQSTMSPQTNWGKLYICRDQLTLQTMAR